MGAKKAKATASSEAPAVEGAELPERWSAAARALGSRSSGPWWRRGRIAPPGVVAPASSGLRGSGSPPLSANGFPREAG